MTAATTITRVAPIGSHGTRVACAASTGAGRAGGVRPDVFAISTARDGTPSCCSVVSSAGSRAVPAAARQFGRVEPLTRRHVRERSAVGVGIDVLRERVGARRRAQLPRDRELRPELAGRACVEHRIGHLAERGREEPGLHDQPVTRAGALATGERDRRGEAVTRQLAAARSFRAGDTRRQREHHRRRSPTPTELASHAPSRPDRRRHRGRHAVRHRSARVGSRFPGVGVDAKALEAPVRERLVRTRARYPSAGRRARHPCGGSRT